MSFPLKPWTIASLGGGVGVCLLLCGGIGYHVCVRRPRQRRLARFQDVDFQVKGAAGAKLEILASPCTHYSTEGMRMARETGTGCNGADHHLAGLQGVCSRVTEEEPPGLVHGAGGGGGERGAGGQGKNGLGAGGGPRAIRSADAGKTPTNEQQRVLGNEEPEIEIMV